MAQVNDEPRAQAAMRRLAEDKAPTNVAQLVMWRVADGLEWDAISRLSQGWANAQELTLARQFVERLGEDQGVSPTSTHEAALYGELTGRDPQPNAQLAELRKLLEGQTVLGLKFRLGVPVRPPGPALACRVRLEGKVARIQLATSNSEGNAWVADGKTFDLPLVDEKARPKEAAEVADALAQGLLDRLTNAKLLTGPRVKGKATYKVRIDNASPLLLNGLAVSGVGDAPSGKPAILSGISLPPHRSLTLPAGTEMIERLGLKKGIRLVGADFSDL